MFLGIPLMDNMKTWPPGAGRAAVVGCCTLRTRVREAGSRRESIGACAAEQQFVIIYYFVEKQLITAIVSEEVESRSSAIFACRSRVISCEKLIHIFLGQFFSVGSLEMADQHVNLTELIVKSLPGGFGAGWFGDRR